MPNSSCAPPRRHPEARDDLVEHQQRPDPVAFGPQAGEEARVGRHQPHVGGDRFDDDAGGALVERGHDVVGRDPGVLHGGVGDPGRTREAQRRQAAPRLGEQQVTVAVVVAGELHHRRPAREAAGGADGRHRRLGAARHQAHHLARRDPGADLLGEQHLALGRGAVARAVGRGPLHGLDDGGVGVAGDDGAVRLHEVDVAGPLGVPHVGALGPGHEVGRAPDGSEGAHGAVDAPRDHALGAGEQLVVGRHAPEDRDTRPGHGHPDGAHPTACPPTT